MPGHYGRSSSSGSRGAPAGGPHGGGGGRQAPAPRPAPRPAPSPAPSPHRDPIPVAPTAVAPVITTQRAMQDKIAAAEKQQAIAQQAKKQSAAETVLQRVKGEKYIGEGVTEASLNRLLAKDPLLEKYDLAKNMNLIKGYADDPKTQEMSTMDQVFEQMENQGLYGYTWPGKPEVYVRDLEKFAPTPDILNPNAMKIEDRNRQIASTISHEFRHDLLDEKAGADIKKRIDLMGLEGPISVGLSDYDKEEIFNRVLDLKSGAGAEQDLRDREYIKSVLGYDIGDRLDPLAEEFISRTTQPYQDRIMREGQKTPGGAYRPPTPLGTDEGLGSFTGAREVPTGEGLGSFEPKETTMPSRNIHKDTGETLAEQKKLNMQQMIARQQEEKYGVGADPTKLGETIDKRTQKEKDEDWERGQDWDLIKDMSKKGYDFNEIQSAAEKGLTVKAPTTSARRQNLIDTGLASIRNIVPETGLEKSLLGRAKRFMPGASGAKEGIMGWGGKMAKNYALSKMGLGWLNPALGVASMLGFKNPFKNMGSRYAVPYKQGPVVGGDGGQGQGQNVIQAGMEKFQPTDQQTAQMDEMRRKMMILQGYADKGSLNERGMSTLAQMNQMISQYQADPRSIYG